MTRDRRRFLTKFFFASILLLSSLLLLYVADLLPFTPFKGRVNTQDEGNAEFLIPSLEELVKLSDRGLAEMYHSYINKVQVLCNRIIRLGTLDDGGWEICEDGQFRPTNPCLVYSFGINNDFSFDDHIASRFNCEVHSFDPSMDLKEGSRGKNLWFHKLGLSDEKQRLETGWELSTLKDILKSNGHSDRKIDVLKVDIEKFEWQALRQIFETGGLQNIRQLVIEFHAAIAGEPSRFEYYLGLALLKNLYESGFRIYHTHRNLWCKFTSDFDDIDDVSCHDVSMVYVP